MIEGTTYNTKARPDVRFLVTWQTGLGTLYLHVPYCDFEAFCTENEEGRHPHMMSKEEQYQAIENFLLSHFTPTMSLFESNHIIENNEKLNGYES